MLNLSTSKGDAGGCYYHSPKLTCLRERKNHHVTSHAWAPSWWAPSRQRWQVYHKSTGHGLWVKMPSSSVIWESFHAATLPSLPSLVVESSFSLLPASAHRGEGYHRAPLPSSIPRSKLYISIDVNLAKFGSSTMIFCRFWLSCWLIAWIFAKTWNLRVVGSLKTSTKYFSRSAPGPSYISCY